jgi:ribosomal protein S18 acetylase RimI-like enzyme
VNPFPAVPVSWTAVVPFGESGRDAFSTVRALRAIEAEHFPSHDDADFGTVESDVTFLGVAPRGLALAIEETGAVAGFCWLIPLSASGEARLLRGERDGGMTLDHLAMTAGDCSAVYMTSVAVRPQFRGQGIGTRLLQCALREMDVFHPKCLLQTAWSACGAGLIRRYSPVRVGECAGHPIYRATWNPGALQPAA